MVRVNLYSYVSSTGENILVTVAAAEVDDSVPTEDEIEDAVKKLYRNRSRGPSGMQAEHLKGWLAASNRGKHAVEKGEEKTEGEEEGGELWKKLVDLVQMEFREGEMVEEATWHTVVLIPKGVKEYRGIGLVEVMWKFVAAILHSRLTTAITYHDFLHGFRAGRGTGTATLEAKLLQELAAMREEVLYVIFLDLTKAYDALERSRSLDILEGYGVGPLARRLLRTHWGKSTMVARAGGYYGTGFQEVEEE